MNRRKKWGFLGKGLYISQPESKPKAEPLNKNQFESWDSKKSNYQRIDLIPKGGFVGGGGVYGGVTPTPSPTPSITPSVTPSETPGLGCLWQNQSSLWENNTNQWQNCASLPTPTPSATIPTTPTPTPTPSSTPAAGYSEAVTYMNAVINAGGYLDSVMSAATIQLFVNLKSDGSWNLLKAFYPYMGMNLNSYKINAKNPGLYDMTWGGGITINASGSTGNGLNAFGNLNYTPFSEETLNDAHIGVYILSNIDSTGYDMGASDVNSKTGIGSRESNTTYYSLQLDASLPVPSNGGGTTDSRGHWIISRTGSTSTTLFKNGVLNDTDAGVSTAVSPSTASYVIHARNNNNTIDAYTRRLITFVHMGVGMSNTQMTNLSSHINTFLTALNRNSY